jgi:hypothetical protein
LSKLTPSVTAMNDFLSFFVTKLEYSAITEKLVSNLNFSNFAGREDTIVQLDTCQSGDRPANSLP